MFYEWPRIGSLTSRHFEHQAQHHPAARSGAAPRHGQPWACHCSAPVPAPSCCTQRRHSLSRAALDVPHQCPCSSVILRHAAAPLLVTGVPLQCPRSSAILLHAAALLLVTGGPGRAAPMPLFQCHPAARSGAAPRHGRPWTCRTNAPVPAPSCCTQRRRSSSRANECLQLGAPFHCQVS
jgi:hypothetical protein